MKFSNFASFVRKQTETNSTSFPNETLTLLSNIAKDSIAEEVVQIPGDYFSIELTTDLIAGQREYSFPVDMLKEIKIIEAKLDGSTWKRLREFDINSYRLSQENRLKPYNVSDISSAFSNATTDEASIIDNFSDDNPQFDNDGNTITIYSGSAIESVTGGLKLRSMIYPDDYTDASWATSNDMSLRSSSTSTAMPRQTHEMIARKVIILFKESNSIPLNAFDLNYNNELEVMKNKLRSPNLDKSTTPIVPRDTGYNY